MPDYIVYHKAEVMGYPAIEVDNLSIYTNKTITEALGGQVWLIAGAGRPREYFLRATFRIHRIEPSDKAEFSARIIGTSGQLLDPMPKLNDELWFPDFVEEQGRFAFGFNRIKNEIASAGFRAVLAANPIL
ncbi:MAG: hypothetical protein PSV26_20425 [Polaromonas sp.]|uniref:hypothetical protein n=1 Tax=Polaromonas sp. TaxID=1869339 RepID=UPI002488EDF1|nr:hypothetical protein [Polaromonas sp.]MDI1239855.1 hypothetical protein [Polaromonas sp.]